MSLSLARRLVRLLNERRQAGLPPEIAAQTRLHIADAVGIALAASAAGEPADAVLRGIARGAGGGACGVFGHPERHAPALAAYANAALIHILDFDDIHDDARLHPTAVTLPAALAAAALVDAPNERVVAAVALGTEAICRLGVLLSPTGQGPGSDWFLTQLFGYFGAAFAAGIVLGFDEDRLVSALGLAYMQAAGGKEAGFGVGSNARAVYPAFAAMGGVQAALFAEAGIVGPEGSFDGLAGLFKVYVGLPLTDAHVKGLLDPHGWVFAATQIKPWPSCRLSHPYVAAALALREPLAGALPASLRVAVNASAAKLCHPAAQRRRPQTLQDAKYSVPWMTAFALLHGRVDLVNLNAAALADARIHELADRITIEETLPDKPGHPPARITATTADGRTIDSPPTLSFDLDAAGVEAKFHACLRAAGRADASPALWQRFASIEAQPGIAFLFGAAEL